MCIRRNIVISSNGVVLDVLYWGNMNIKYIYSKKYNKIIVIYDENELYEINKIFEGEDNGK